MFVLKNCKTAKMKFPNRFPPPPCFSSSVETMNYAFIKHGEEFKTVL